MTIKIGANICYSECLRSVVKGSILRLWGRIAGLTTVHTIVVLVLVPLWSMQHQSAKGLVFVWIGDTLLMAPVVRKQYKSTVSENSSSMHIFLYTDVSTTYQHHLKT